MSAAQTGAALAAHRVDFIDEDDGRRGLLGLLEQIAHAGRAHADEHFHKIRAGDGEEGNARFPRDGARQQGFARSGRAHQQDARGNLRAQIGKALGILQKFHQLAQLVLFLVRAGYVPERDLVGLGIGQARAGAAEIGHALAAAAALRAHQEEPQCDDHQDHQHVGQQPQPPGRLRGQPVRDLKAVFRGADRAAEHACVDGVHVRVELLPAGNDAAEVVIAAELRVGDLAVFDASDEPGLLDDDLVDGHALLSLGKRLAEINSQVGLDPFQQRGIAERFRLHRRAGAQLLHHQQNRGQQQHVHQRPLQKTAQR